MKLTRMDVRGFSHELLLIAFVSVFAIAGVGFLVASHANSAPRCVQRVFRQGATGGCVQYIQYGLDYAPYYGSPWVKPDGRFGPSTKAAVIHLQKAVAPFAKKHSDAPEYSHWAVTGTVGAKTWLQICTNLYSVFAKGYYNQAGCGIGYPYK